MKRILLVSHCPSPNTLRLRDAVIAGIEDPEIAGVRLVQREPLRAEARDVLEADAVLIGTTENFGYMAGRIKDFFERIYYPCLEETQGKPWALWVRAGNDGRGAVRSIESICTGLRWRQVVPPLRLAGDFDPAFIEQCRELGMTLAAGLEAGLW